MALSWMAHAVHCDVIDDGHVLRAVAGSQSGQIVMEDEIDNPVQAVLDAPMGAHRGGEGLGVGRRRGEVTAPLPRDRAISFDAAFDRADRGQMRKGRSSKKATTSRWRAGRLAFSGKR